MTGRISKGWAIALSAALAMVAVAVASSVIPIGPNVDRAEAAPLAVSFAQVNHDGTVNDSKGLHPAGVVRRDDGDYLVRFGRNVRGCAYSATIGWSGVNVFFPVSGEIGAFPSGQFVGGVVVYTFDSAGTQADRPFYLVVNC